MSLEIQHIINRGVDKRVIFQDDNDYRRFIYDLWEFNDIKKSHNTAIHQIHSDIGSRSPEDMDTPLVTLYAFSLMPNHYHLLMSEACEHGIPRFMQKVNIGYAKYFNQRYERKGTLFESRYKKIPIESEGHFIHIPYYIHCNPLDLAFPEWRNRTLVDPNSALDFLGSYLWSSHLDYMGKANFPWVTQRDYFLELFGGEKAYAEAMRYWLQNMTPSDIGSR